MQSVLQKEEYLEEVEQQEQQVVWAKGQRLYTFLLAGLLVSGLIVGSILAYEGCSYSYYPFTESVFNDIWNNILLNDNFLMHVMVVGVLGLLLWSIERGFSKLSRGMQETICVSILAVTAVLLFAAGTIFVHTTTYYPEGDQLNATAGAYYCMNGSYIMLSPHGYIGMYQQQKGLMFLYEILFRLFGEFCYDVAAQFHVLFAVLTLVSGYGFIKNQSSKAFHRIIFCVIMLFCMPFMIFLPYIYGDIPSICFCMILFWALSAYAKKLQKRYIAIASVAAALSLMCRMNTWIVLIAVAIGMVMFAIEKWNYKPLIAGLCIILSAAGAIKAVDVMYEYRSGYESGVGIPSILWVAMGLQETDGEAGVYNRYQQTVFEENDFQKEASAQVGKEYIAERLEEFANDLPMAKDFFLEKMRSQWMEPLFESMAATSSFQKEKPLADWIDDLYYGDSHSIIWKLSNYYQSLVYVAVLLCLIGSSISFKKKKRSSVGWIPEIAIIGGFLFSLMWENQSRYCLPYYVFMLLYVPEGIMQIGTWIEHLWKNITSKSNSAKKDKDKPRLRKVS